jgi:Holliday junction resolvase RusA-like endonuclease
MVRNGRAEMFDANKGLRAWRETVTLSAIQAMKNNNHTGFTRGEPVSLHVIFYFTKPKTSKNRFPVVKPDLDKLIRAIGDSLQTAGLIAGDEQIVSLMATKRYDSVTDYCQINLHKIGEFTRY